MAHAARADAGDGGWGGTPTSGTGETRGAQVGGAGLAGEERTILGVWRAEPLRGSLRTIAELSGNAFGRRLRDVANGGVTRRLVRGQGRCPTGAAAQLSLRARMAWAEGNGVEGTDADRIQRRMHLRSTREASGGTG